jgi:uncharacterized protein
MKKLLSLALALLMLMSLAVAVSAATPGSEQFIYDDAQLLSENQAAKLQDRLQELSDKYDTQIVVATLQSVNGGDADILAEAFYDGKDLGYGDSRDGILLIIMMDIREFRIVSNGEAADALTLDRIDKITDVITPELSDGEYYDAFREFADKCEYYLDGHINGFPFDVGKSLVIALVIGIVAGLIVANTLKAQLKTLHIQTRAHDYVKAGSMQLTYQKDLYLYRTVQQTRKQTSNSNSGSSGGSRNVGGGKF